ncbi:MAG: aminomethyl transferase family protein [Hyphomicrobiales bacterium]|nr:aminomethyl transferase family protein [Hyphomicrobiales bacterium]MCP5074911.1 aminomethyl transferase family protein [Paracoccaceae bacterium]
MESATQQPESLSELLENVPKVVDHLFRNPPKNALTIFTQMMPGDVVRPEFTTWRDEQRSWRQTIALHDQSYHMHSLHLRGPGALDLCQYLVVNSFRTFEVGAAKQLVTCSPDGFVIGDGILYRLEEEHFLVVANPSTTDWVEFNAQALEYEVEAELDPMWALNKAKKRNFYRYQVEGPNAWQLLEKLHGGPLPEIKFFKSDILTIADCKVRGMRHTMGGVPGLELSGPWGDRNTVKKALVQEGKAFGLRQIGSIAYFTTVVESGWWAVPVSAVYTSPAMKPYRDWLTANNAAMRMSLGGSFYSPNIEDYYLTPYDLNYGHLVKFDHDFIGREALEKIVNKPHRKKVTLVWNAEDVLKVMQSQFEDGSNPLPITMPLPETARLHYDRVIDKDGNTIGLSHYPGYTINEHAMMSLGSIDAGFAEHGTEVTVVWGEDGGGSRSAGNIELHEQTNIRAIVAPSPISRAAQSYRSEIGVKRGSLQKT